MQLSTPRPFHFLLKLCFIGALFLSARPSIQAQGNLEIIQVPDQMTFSGIKLKLDEDARDAVQKKVNGLMRSASFYKSFVDRCNIFFPIIEDVFQEESLPLDFRFLALQESALIADAVSRSNAVGYWQFKDATARELGLMVGKDIDERKNIVLASRAAAKYLKKNNYFMKNWVYTLLSYNLGLTGANNISDRSKIGAKEMDLDGETHPYIIHLLAHKAAFENSVGKDNDSNRLTLVEYPDASNMTVSDIAKKSDVDPELLTKYNRWLNGDKVPMKAKSVPFLIPVKVKDKQTLLAKIGSKGDDGKTNGKGDNTSITSNTGNNGKNNTGKPTAIVNNGKYPIIKGKRQQRFGAQKVTLATANGIDAVIPDDKTDMPTLVGLLKISRNKFMKYNDMDINSELEPDVPYYLKKKKSKTPTDAEFHVTQYGETMWEVAQIYGIKQKSLRKSNRMAVGEEPAPGRVLWLKKKRPSSTPVEIRDIGPKPEPKKDDADVKWEVPEKTVEEILVGDDTNKKNGTTTTPPIVTDDRFHVVKKGETLFEVSRQYKISPIRLAELNKLPEDMSIREGQILIVKENAVGSGINTDTDPLDGGSEDAIYIDENGNVVKKPATNGSGTGDVISSGGDTPGMVSNAMIHIVRPQENLYSIARIYKVTHRDIVEWNNLQPLEVLKIGQKIYVSNPNAPTTPPKVDTKDPGVVVVKRAPITHTVGAGETLYGISKKYGVGVLDVINWNNLDANTPISVGQVLKVEDPNAITEVEVKKAENGTTSRTATSDPVFHTVKAGDDLPNIAYKYKTSVDEILRINHMTTEDVLFEGQTLLVKEAPQPVAPKGNGSVAEKGIITKDPAPVSTGQTQAKTHTVKAGDTVYGLSRAYGIKPDELRKWNNMNDNTLSVGQKVIVGYETVVPPTNNTGTGASNVNTGGNTGSTTGTTPPKSTDGPNVSRANSTNSGNYIGETPVTPKETVVTPEYYVVKKGDTLYSIARNTNLSVNQLKILNEGLNPQSLAIGQKIRIK